ncbi:uncharacterized protein LOC106076326 isoform X2 [Biomphalaria glabrata]|uniref:Uncharacterized protein LOC106076326 isoform X2 n=1 Tax=Biomphalaria glabrata TaxID=6526 RepID=A0A9W3A5Z7_BIOGL|nr:uncharacterized protein LOC106076326 isoform X2 [Biomphalaria glabrata]
MELKYPLILTLFIVSVKSDCESIINFCERDRLNRPGLTCMYVKEGVDCIVNKGCDLKTYDKIKNFTESWTKILKERNCSISLKELMWTFTLEELEKGNGNTVLRASYKYLVVLVTMIGTVVFW